MILLMLLVWLILYYLLMIPMCVVSEAMFSDIVHFTNSYGTVVIIAHAQYTGGLLWHPWHTLLLLLLLSLLLLSSSCLQCFDTVGHQKEHLACKEAECHNTDKADLTGTRCVYIKTFKAQSWLISCVTQVV